MDTVRQFILPTFNKFFNNAQVWYDDRYDSLYVEIYTKGHNKGQYKTDIASVIEARQLGLL